MNKNRLSNRLLIDEQPHVNVVYWLTWLLLLIVTFGSLIIYGRYIIEQSISKADQAQQLSQAQLEHLKNRLDKGQFGSLTVDDITTSYLNIDSAEGKVQFLKDLGLDNLIEVAQNPGLIGSLPANFANLVGSCFGCVMLQTKSPGLPQLGHMSVAGIGTFGGLVSTADIGAVGNLRAGTNVEAAGNVTAGGSVSAPTVSGTVLNGTTVNATTLGVFGNASFGGKIGIGTNSPITQLHLAGTIPTAELSSVATNSGPISVVAKGGYVYVANYIGDSLQIFNYNDPANPTLISTTATFSGPTALVIEGKYAYVTVLGSNGLQIFDISNPTIPTMSGFTNTVDQPSSISVQGRYAYVLSLNENKIQAVDIGNPLAPRVMGSAATGATPTGIKVVGRYAYVVSVDSAIMQIFDISNPSTPILIGTVSTNSGPTAIAVQDRYAYIANSTAATIQIVDISNPLVPTIASTITTGPNPTSIFIQDRYAYVTSFGGNALVAYDISNANQPSLLGYIDTGVTSTPSSVYVQGRYGYVTTYGTNTLKSYDLGGAYLQQVQAGGLIAGSLEVKESFSTSNNADFGGAVSVGRGLSAYGNSSFYGQVNVSTGATDIINQIIQASVGQTADLLQAKDSTGAILAKIDATGNLTVKNAVINGTFTVNGHIITGGNTPAIAVEAAAGAGATVSISGNDTLGTITITTGAAPVVGDLASITFAAAFGTAPKVILTPANASGSTIEYFQGLVTTNTFRMASGSVPAASTTYIFNYWVGQ